MRVSTPWFPLFLLASWSAVALAQPTPCTANVPGTPPEVPAEDLYAPVADIVFNCTGPLAPAGQEAFFRVSLNTNVTSQVLTSKGELETLFVDNANPTQVISPCRLVNPRTFECPSTAAEAARNGQRSYRIIGIHGNANQIFPEGATPAEINYMLGYSTIEDLRRTQIQDLGELRLASVRQGSFFETTPANMSGPDLVVGGTTHIAFTELNPNAWPARPLRGLERANFNARDTFFGEIYARFARQSRGARLFSSLENIPNGTQLLIPATIGGGAFVANLVQVNGSTQLPPVLNLSVALSVSNNRANFTYEIERGIQDLLERLEVPVTISRNGDFGTAFVTTDKPEFPPSPRLTNANGERSFTLNSCRTSLLYPFVADKSEFDSGLFVQNTSCDSFANDLSFTRGRQALPLFTRANPAAAPGSPSFSVPTGIAVSPSGFQLTRPADNFHLNVIGPNGPITFTGLTLSASNTKLNQIRSNWLDVEQTGTQTPFALRIAVDGRNLAPGQYSGAIGLARQGGAPLNLPVILTVPPLAPTFHAYGVTNAASYQPALIAPGEAIVIFGQRLGPSMLTLAGVDSSGLRATTAGGTRVLFDGVAAPMIYSAAGQVSCFVPYGVVTLGDSRIEVEYQGVKSLPIRVPVAWAKPALLTADASGGGLAAAINQNGTFNSVTGAQSGDVVVLYGVGGPQTEPASTDGATYAAPLPKFPGAISVFLDGEKIPGADVLYAGPAPGLTHGVWQLNLRLPANLIAGSRPHIMVRIGEFWTQPGVRLNVQ